jgi:hypothetical protein
MSTLDNLLDSLIHDFAHINDDELGEDKFKGHHNPTLFKASLIDYIEGLIPPPENNYMYQDKHWVAGYNQAIDDMRAKLKGKEI